MPTVEILRGVVAIGVPRKVGERVEVDSVEARLLVGVGRAKLVDPSLPVVLTDAPEEPQPAKRRGRKAKSKEAPSAGPPPLERERARESDGRFLGDDPSTPDTNEAWVEVDADPSDE